MDSRRSAVPAYALALVGLGLAAGAGLWWMGPVPGPGDWPVRYLRGYLVAWVAYVCAGYLVRRTRHFPRWALIWIVVVAAVLHVVAFVRAPRPSTDIYRYLWDGRVVNAGINPYLYAPDAPQIAHLRDENWRYTDCKDIRTIYPPAAQLLFAGLVRAGASHTDSFRCVFGVFDIASVLLLIAALRRTGRAPEHVIWYAWCPLAATESAAGGHVDAVEVFLLVLALLLAARNTRPGAASALALAAAVMTKGFALLAAPFFIRRGGRGYAVWLAIGCVALAAPFLGAGRHLFDGLTTYLSGWKVNAGLFNLASWLLARVTPAFFLIARLGSMMAIVAVTAWLACRPGQGRQRTGPEGLPAGRLEGMIAGVFMALGALLLFGAPTLPWYVICVVPALCWWSVPGLALFTLTVVAQYHGTRIWEGRDALLLWMGYTPVCALLIRQFVQTRRVRSAAAISTGEARSTG